MVKALETLDESPFILRTRPTFEMSNDDFFQFCAANPFFRMERNVKGEIIIMFPEGGSSGAGNAELTYYFMAWAKNHGAGRVFGSSAGFILKGKAVRSPDVSWVSDERLSRLNEEEWDKFLPLCPDFVLELRSKSDSLRVLQNKMAEYRSNGARLGWLIDPYSRTIYIYRPRRRVEVGKDPAELSGELVLPGFVLKMEDLWKATQLGRFKDAKRTTPTKAGRPRRAANGRSSGRSGS